MLERARAVYEENKTRRTTRHFSSRDVDKSFIELAILSGGTAPNGAHLQPWTWVAISDTDLKRKIRRAAEEEERRTYEQRMPEAWAEVLAPPGQMQSKHLTDAPWIVVLLRQKKRLRDNGEWGPTYYPLNRAGSPYNCLSTPCTA